jgi:hypothetical protein
LSVWSISVNWINPTNDTVIYEASYVSGRAFKKEKRRSGFIFEIRVICGSFLERLGGIGYNRIHHNVVRFGCSRPREVENEKQIASFASGATS